MSLSCAMVLAAGRGERMRPLTAARAKPSLPVLGVPLVARIVRRLADEGIARFAVNAHHAPGSLRDALAAADAPGRAIELFVEPALMGSGGALAAPSALLGAGEHFALHNGDTLLDPPLAALLDAARGCDLGALLVRRGRTGSYTPVLTGGGLLRGLGASTGTPWDDATYLGAAVLHRRVLDHVPHDRPTDLFRDVLLPELARGATLGVVEYGGAWLEFTDPATYRAQVLALCADHARAAALPGGAAAIARHGDARLFAAPGATIAPDARLAGCVVVETGATIASGAHVADAVLLEHVAVAAGARVTGEVRA